MPNPKFATALNCMDGRAQTPVADWVKLHFRVDYVDMITEPGIDNVLLKGSPQTIRAIEDKVRLSFQRRNSPAIVIAAHHDCIANPVSKEVHWRQIEECVRVIESWGMVTRVAGLWVNEWNSIDVVIDPNETRPRTSFL